VHCTRVADAGDFANFFAVDHKHVAQVRVDDGPARIVDASAPQLRLRESPSLLAWLRLGIHHIDDWDGRDHISFVLALLLVVMLTCEPGGPRRVRPLGAALRATATVVTAFTIAHSVSLISAALGWVSLPSRLVETLIALSIAYTAAENIVKPDVRWRFALTFAFGLIHGLGFASTLAVQLPPRDVVVPLIYFNIGVEIGQLAIVLLALPVFYVLAARLGAMRYRRFAMPAVSAAIFLAGLVWVLERAVLT
jgi:hypothetical protein